MGAGRKAQRVVRGPEQPFGGGGHAADPPHLPGGQLGVAAHPLVAGGGVALGLHGPGGQHLLAQFGTALGRGRGVKLIKGHGVHLHAEVDAVQQRAGHPAAILPHRAGRAGAGVRGVAVVAALAGVHGGHQLEPAGVGGTARCTAHGDLSVLQRLAQHFQAVPGKLRQFVQKQYAAVCQTAFAGTESVAAARQCRRAGRVMGAAEGPGRDQPPPFGQLACDGIYFGGLHGLFPGQGRQDAGQALCQHGFAGAGCPDEQYVVSACRRQHHGPAGQRLAHHVREIRGDVPPGGGVKGDGRGRGEGSNAPQGVHHFQRCAGGVDLHGIAACFCRLGGVFGGDIQAADAVRCRRQCHGQHTRDRPQTAVQCQLSQKGRVGGRLIYLAGGGQHRQQQGQVIHRAAFADVRRGQVHRDMPVRPLEAQILHSRAHPVAAFPHGRVRQAHQRKGGQAPGNVGLHRHGKAVEAVQAIAFQNRIHGASFCRAKRRCTGTFLKTNYSCGKESCQCDGANRKPPKPANVLKNRQKTGTAGIFVAFV